jgi:fatty acid desaturase
MKLVSTIIFPVIQVFSLYGSINTFGENPYTSFTLFLISCVALNFSIHVSLHEFVHHYQPKSNHDFLSLIFSYVAGLPFDGYRLHHYNHHQFNNQINDYSSTWKITASGYKPYNLGFYAFGWLLFLEKARKHIQKQIKNGELPDLYRARLQFQRIGILLLYIALLSISKTAFLLYFFHIYFGWVLISIHNYGQHPPVASLRYQPTTFAGLTFNSFFFKNGLHWEHHKEPSKPWADLEISASSPRIQVPHLIEPLLQTDLENYEAHT